MSLPSLDLTGTERLIVAIALRSTAVRAFQLGERGGVVEICRLAERFDPGGHEVMLRVTFKAGPDLIAALRPPEARRRRLELVAGTEVRDFIRAADAVSARLVLSGEGPNDAA